MLESYPPPFSGDASSLLSADSSAFRTVCLNESKEMSERILEVNVFALCVSLCVFICEDG